MPSTSAKGHCLGFPSCGEPEETQEGTRIVTLWSQGKAAARKERSREQGELGQGSLTAVSMAQALKYPHKPCMDIPGIPCSPYSSAHHTQHFPFMGMGCGMAALDT